MGLGQLTIMVSWWQKIDSYFMATKNIISYWFKNVHTKSKTLNFFLHLETEGYIEIDFLKKQWECLSNKNREKITKAWFVMRDVIYARKDFMCTWEKCVFWWF